MIVKVKTEAQTQLFLRAVEPFAGFRAMAQARLSLFRDLEGSGWQFYTAELGTNEADRTGGMRAWAQNDAQREPPAAALYLRGDTASLVGNFDAEELESFLSFLGVDTVMSPEETTIGGFSLAETMTIFTLAAGEQVASVPLDDRWNHSEIKLERNPSLAPILDLLWGDETEQEVKERYYSDACIARNMGMAEFFLVQADGRPIFTLAASAICQDEVYLSAGETVEEYRGRGLGGQMITQIANEYAAKGKLVSFIAKEERYPFYQRLGFRTSGVLCRYQRDTKVE